jgi:phosphate transport system permease protein
MKDKIFKYFLNFSALLLILLLGIIFLFLVRDSLPALNLNILSLFSNKTWDPLADSYTFLPFIVGTLMTSFIALMISYPFSISIAYLLSQYLKKGIFRTFIESSVELLAAVPSVIYGLAAYFMLLPPIRMFQVKIGVAPYGVGIFSASLVLSIMIIPYSASIAREVFLMCPRDLQEAAYSLGATKQEVITKVVFPFGKSGVLAGVLLSLGRALGETMAVTMLIGNSNFLPKSIFSPSNTMASVIANEFAESTSFLHSSNLILMALLLFIITSIINLIGKLFIKKAAKAAS